MVVVKVGMVVVVHLINVERIAFDISTINNYFNSNQLRAGGVHKHNNTNVCDRCHNEVYSPVKVRCHIDNHITLSQKSSSL